MSVMLAKGMALLVSPVVGYVLAKAFMGRYKGKRDKEPDTDDNTSPKE